MAVQRGEVLSVFIDYRKSNCVLNHIIKELSHVVWNSGKKYVNDV